MSAAAASFKVAVDSGRIDHLAICESCGYSVQDGFSERTAAQRWARSHVRETGHVVAVQAERVTWYRPAVPARAEDL